MNNPATPVSRHSPSKRAVGDLDNVSDRSERWCRQPRLQEASRSPTLPRDGSAGLQLIQSPLLKSYMKQHPEARRRFEGGDQMSEPDVERRSDSSATATSSGAQRERPTFEGMETADCSVMTSPGISGLGNYRMSRSPSYRYKTPSSKLTISSHLQSILHMHRPLRTSNAIVRTDPRAKKIPFKPPSIPTAPLAVAPTTITLELTKALSSDDEHEVVEALTNVSTMAFCEEGLGIEDLVNKHFRTELLFFGSGAYTQSGLVRIASLMRETKWRTSLQVQQAALAALVCGIKLTFDCVPSDLTATDDSGSEPRYPSGRSRRNVLQADTFTISGSVVDSIELAMKEADSSCKHDLVYTGLGALWHLASCPFRGKDCLSWMFWKENGLYCVFDAMSASPRDRRIQQLGKAIITLALRADKAKTVEIGLDWNMRANL